ncbi:MAG: VIT1/CCC1 transporter family protein [Actinobacteria bacterium]|nr:VIT1/CCC1 transporter family protein [Actinomycetota bacterium]
MIEADRIGVLSRLRRHLAPRQWAVDANDGIIATAGLLEGFAGAGADDRVLLTAASAMIIAGSLGLGGAKSAEEAGELDAERAIIAEEQAQLAANPDTEVAELAAYWESKGLSHDLARRVSEQLSARDALAAQLEYEHGIDEPTPAWHPAWAGVTSGLAFLLGALIPLLITLFLPVQIEPLAIMVTVILSLLLTSLLAARTGHMSVKRTIARTLAVGVGTIGISYLLGSLLF